MENSFKNGEIKTIGTDIVNLMPPTSIFKRTTIKERIIEKFKAFFQRFFGISSNSMKAPEGIYGFGSSQDDKIAADDSNK